jgi:hypothetical protein
MTAAGKRAAMIQGLIDLATFLVERDFGGRVCYLAVAITAAHMAEYSTYTAARAVAPREGPAVMTGPFESDREVTQTPQVQAVYAAFEAAPGAGKMAPHNFLMLVNACEAAGVDLGSPASRDRQVLAWLAGWEPQTCAVVAGLIARARHAAGVTLDAAQLDRVLDALDDAATYRRRQVGESCADCDAAADEGVCADHLDDFDLADAYDMVAGDLKREAGR